MTPAIELLKKLKINFTIHKYKHDPSEINFGKEAVEKLDPCLNIVAEQVFKTLIVCLNNNSKDLAVCVVPVNHQLDLKKAAKLLGSKKVELANFNTAQKVTGYLIGGISPIGQKRQLPTLIDKSALVFQTVFVSAGQRGLEVEISPQDLATVLDANIGEIIN